jgi:hypothetical protein
MSACQILRGTHRPRSGTRWQTSGFLFPALCLPWRRTADGRPSTSAGQPTSCTHPHRTPENLQPTISCKGFLRQADSRFFDLAVQKRLKHRYDRWVRAGLKAHPEQLHSTGKWGQIKQTTQPSLLRRLRNKREEVLGLVNDLSNPFDNIQAMFSGNRARLST